MGVGARLPGAASGVLTQIGVGARFPGAASGVLTRIGAVLGAMPGIVSRLVGGGWLGRTWGPCLRPIIVSLIFYALPHFCMLACQVLPPYALPFYLH